MKNWYFLINVLWGRKIEIFSNNELGGWKIEISYESCTRIMKNCSNNALWGWKIEVFLKNVLGGWKIKIVWIMG